MYYGLVPNDTLANITIDQQRGLTTRTTRCFNRYSELKIVTVQGASFKYLVTTRTTLHPS